MLLNLATLIYLGSGILFILSLKGLSSPETARRGNLFGMIGMGLAVFATLLLLRFDGLAFIGLFLVIALGALMGAWIAYKIPMTAMPQLVAGFHSLVGLAAVLIALAAFYTPESFHLLDAQGQMKQLSLLELSVGSIIGAITFSGSVIAFAKLQGLLSGSAVLLPFRHWINGILTLILVAVTFFFIMRHGVDKSFLFLLVVLSFALGVLLIIPIGGADMPVIVSMLNSYSGWAAAALGFTLDNIALIITGALVGSSGAILSYIMCKGMNRSFFSVLLGGFGSTHSESLNKAEKTGGTVKEGAAEDAAFILKNANHVIIVPGYGMAVAQAQNALAEMAEMLKEKGVGVSYAIHPVAGRMPGHMNVLLAEAKISYDEVFELEDINNDFAQTDVVFVIGANDVTNPAAKTDKESPIYGMPVLEVDKAGIVLFVKRSLSPGYAGVDNALFYRENTLMLFGDAKKVVEKIIKVF